MVDRTYNGGESVHVDDRRVGIHVAHLGVRRLERGHDLRRRVLLSRRRELR